jgi:hypothetical protein
MYIMYNFQIQNHKYHLRKQEASVGTSRVLLPPWYSHSDLTGAHGDE